MCLFVCVANMIKRVVPALRNTGVDFDVQSSLSCLIRRSGACLAPISLVSPSPLEDLADDEVASERC
jgi:hypothetical protein